MESWQAKIIVYKRFASRAVLPPWLWLTVTRHVRLASVRQTNELKSLHRTHLGKNILDWISFALAVCAGIRCRAINVDSHIYNTNIPYISCWRKSPLIILEFLIIIDTFSKWLYTFKSCHWLIQFEFYALSLLEWY